MKISAIALAIVGASANAADWSDASLSYSHGSSYHEPANTHDVTKDILSLSYLGGNSVGHNYFNVDMLRSNKDNPANNGTSGAQEVYVVLRNVLSFGKLSDKKLSFGPVSDVGLESGIDFSSKNDAFGGAEFKWMVGPMVQFNVPGFWTLSLLALKDTGNNSLAGVHVNSPITWRLSTAWSFDFQAGAPVVFKGWATYTGTRGKDGFGGPTYPEVWFWSSLTWDVGSVFGAKPKKYYAGVGYEYVRNKFNDSPNLIGTKTSVPSIRFEAHF
ncbi:hypothetical protein [Pelomonas sp. KK5]|uniref:hypothetical protein n=1 Tax=Pelomonas sp. KK5 TaxID=1855730 RepID=UPI0018EA0274|nr:hypothetical protein [Pelomonas sp. KK5]